MGLNICKIKIWGKTYKDFSSFSGPERYVIFIFPTEKKKKRCRVVISTGGNKNKTQCAVKFSAFGK